ncbi:MAG: NAD(P)-binding domain-containing protein [Clostridia bacterium]|nr:NAD(P)-binding domain-containing protein [Deltaproteobacteria bacterium]
MTKVGVLGSGTVGETLANGFLKHGYGVMRGSREPNKLAAWRSKSSASTGTFAETAAFGEIVVLAVKGDAALDVIRACGTALDGKVVLDTTNPITADGPDEGMLTMFTGPNDSLIERLQRANTKARFVKCFSCVGGANMVNPPFPERPTMFICGNDKDAKADTTRLLDIFGWDTEDLGGVKGGRAIEPLCIAWCAPGFLENRWTHAFRVMKR